MAIDDPEVVDAIGLERDSGVVALTISDHLEWHSSDEHLRALERKINRYLGFIESGELVESYPSAAGRPVRIDVWCKYTPPSHAIAFLEEARRVAGEYGVSFEWRMLHDVS